MKKGFFFLLFSMLIVVMTACDEQSSSTNGGNSYTQVSNTKADKGKQVNSGNVGEEVTNIQLLNNDIVGNYLADGKGMTLYHYTKDEPGVSTCTASCLQSWPAFYGDIKNLKVSAGFNRKDFGTITREDTGKMQITYKGYPLYYYIPDQAKGDVKGQGVDGVWFIVNANTKLKKGQNDDKLNVQTKHNDNNGY